MSQYTQSLEKLNPQLFSTIRRHINSLKEKQLSIRKISIMELLAIIKKQSLPTQVFQEIAHMCLKDCLKCFSDIAEVCRQNSVQIVMELIARCRNINSFLPYIFSVLVDRTNCYDLEGINNLPEKMRPQPGQKPKMMVKNNETCQQIRKLYCQLLQKIISLIDQNQVRKYLDDIVNILRTLIMDPSPQIQKIGCNALEIFCKEYKLLLLHYTEILGRAVLLPLIAKKSKIRIAGLNALTAIFWCGLWKYNAFVFQNLIGFRDPNSVPIKDFYEPSHNINYLATFIIDQNVKVRQQFMHHLNIWICKLDDKYDHHGKLVPYLLSGLFDTDQLVRKTALESIDQIGRQIEIERQKDFRDNKQFAIDATWTWNGKLIDLPLAQPLSKRPSLGSRFFIRGHVRKMWHALYKEIKDINTENKIRAVNLTIYGVIYTQNYLTQFLDNLIPQLLPSIISNQHENQIISQKISLIFYYIGRYCEQSSYLHLIKSSLAGELIQNQHFIKASMKGLAMLIKGNLQTIPTGQGLCHKKQDVIDILNLLSQSGILSEIYNYNCKQAKQIALNIIKGIKEKGKIQEIHQILSVHFITILKFIGVSYYEQYYSTEFVLKKQESGTNFKNSLKHDFVPSFQEIQKLYPNNNDQIRDYLSQMYQNPPTLQDSDWKFIIILHNYYTILPRQKEIFQLIQDIISESLTFNKSVEIINFVIKYIHHLIESHQISINTDNIISTHSILVNCMNNLLKFKPIKKVPIYDQIQDNSNQLKINQDSFIIIFKQISNTIRKYYLQKIQLNQQGLANTVTKYLQLYSKIKRNKDCFFESIKTIWVIFQRNTLLNLQFPQKFRNKQKQYMIPKIIDFLIERLETIGENIDPKKINMVFGTLQRILQCWPTMGNITDKLPYIYPNYPQLFDTIVKYALNEKDIETGQKYTNFLISICKKMPKWFQYEADMTQKSKRFQKSKYLNQIIKNSGI